MPIMPEDAASPMLRAGLGDVLSHIPDFGRDFLKFLLHPRSFVSEWKNFPLQHHSILEVVGWTIAFVALLFNLYKLAFRSSWLTKMLRAAGVPETPDVTKDFDTAKPRLVGIGVMEKQFGQGAAGSSVGAFINFGLEISFPEAVAKGTNEPQILCMQTGFVKVYFANVAPDAFGSHVVQTLFFGIYSLVTVFCLHVPAVWLGGTASFQTAFNMVALFYAYLFLLVSLFAVAGVLLCVDILRLNKVRFHLAWVVLVVAPAFVLAFRCFLGSFSQLYNFSITRLLLATCAGGIASLALTPLVFVPLAFLAIRFKDYWEALV